MQHEFKPVDNEPPNNNKRRAIAYLAVGGRLVNLSSERIFNSRESNRQPLHSDLDTSPLSSSRLGSSWIANLISRENSLQYFFLTQIKYSYPTFSVSITLTYNSKIIFYHVMTRSFS